MRPLEFGIKPLVDENVIKIKLLKPTQFTVEVNGYHNALHIFANRVEAMNIDQNDPKIHYYGPGIHEVGIINVKSDETVFIDGWAVA